MLGVGNCTPLGTTSACAENTISHRGRACPPGNYLRVRGEYMLSWSKSCGSGELPPRARRIRVVVCDLAHALGTTSACAENTQAFIFLQHLLWNYLRVRGEYSKTVTP